MIDTRTRMFDTCAAHGIADCAQCRGGAEAPPASDDARVRDAGGFSAASVSGVRMPGFSGWAMVKRGDHTIFALVPPGAAQGTLDQAQRIADALNLADQVQARTAGVGAALGWRNWELVRGVLHIGGGVTVDLAPALKAAGWTPAGEVARDWHDAYSTECGLREAAERECDQWKTEALEATERATALEREVGRLRDTGAPDSLGGVDLEQSGQWRWEQASEVERARGKPPLTLTVVADDTTALVSHVGDAFKTCGLAFPASVAGTLEGQVREGGDQAAFGVKVNEFGTLTITFSPAMAWCVEIGEALKAAGWRHVEVGRYAWASGPAKVEVAYVGDEQVFPTHPVDAFKVIAERAGWQVDPEWERTMRAICDQPVRLDEFAEGLAELPRGLMLTPAEDRPDPETTDQVRERADCYGSGCDEFPGLGVRIEPVGAGERFTVVRNVDMPGMTSREQAERMRRTYNPRPERSPFAEPVPTMVIRVQGGDLPLGTLVAMVAAQVRRTLQRGTGRRL